ncbi:MAG TPA: CaiB/BaiF CoA-transferase family protein [Rhodopila sp.]|uniref:CaiB/BaiF CoA transferase family protein n=1 Tax=Rhodopila sp. TaxID=2480087 RepID=UPI002BC57A89|nr:CaiB/BaiF CoA-transferase family protein [Rhodopila sp.]HVY16956.1 CaiB/BaiF CoA-transferase family protein [Rhodopila sp.]
MTRPLEGCRVLDLGIITAGAATSALLADLGATVLKVESPTYRDPFRVWIAAPDGKGDLSPFFRFTNRGKRGVSLDLKQPAGRDAFLRLAVHCDIVVENFRRSVLDRLGIGYAALKAANAGIILASISSQGETGPLAQYVSFGSTLEAVAGLASLTGYAGGPPVLSGKEVNLPDQNIALFAAGMILTAWLARRRGGGGVHLDLAQRELTSFMIGEAFAASPPLQRVGNAEPPFALQDCVLAGDSRYFALSVTEDQLPALERLVGGEGLLASRLAAWTARLGRDEAVAALQAAGIAAAPVLDGRGMAAMRGTLWSQAIAQHPHYGQLKGVPFQLDGAPLHTDGDAPAIGADTEAVLAEIGGFSREEIAALLANGAAETAG